MTSSTSSDCLVLEGLVPHRPGVWLWVTLWVTLLVNWCCGVWCLTAMGYGCGLLCGSLCLSFWIGCNASSNNNDSSGSSTTNSSCSGCGSGKVFRTFSNHWQTIALCITSRTSSSCLVLEGLVPHRPEVWLWVALWVTLLVTLDCV